MEVPHPPRAAWTDRSTHDNPMDAGTGLFVLVVLSPVLVFAALRDLARRIRRTR